MKSKTRSKVWAILGTLVMILPLFVGLGSVKTSAANEETQTITLHKKKFTTEQTPAIQNTGEVMNQFETVEGLADVEFTVYDVTADFYTERAKGATMDDALATVKNATGTKVDAKTTDANGDVSFDLVKKDSEGRYKVYVFKESEKDGVTTPADNLVVAFPVYKMNEDGTTSDDEITGEVHLYPKNVISVNGAMELTKTGTAEGELLSGAEFIISRVEAGTTKYLSGVKAGLYTWSTEKADAHVFVTGNSYSVGEDTIAQTEGEKGKLAVTGLEVGSYKTIETKAPDNAAIIESEKEKDFTIVKDVTTPVTVAVKNDTSKVEKTTPELDGKPVNIGDAIKYQITVNIPEGIGDKNEDGAYIYTKLNLLDTNDEALTLNDENQSLQVDGEDITFTIENQTATGFTVVPTIDQLRTFGGKTLTFTYYMHLNELADPTKGFTNSADVDNDYTHDKTPGETDVTTSGKRFVKVDASHDTTLLAGAEFVVRDGNTEDAKYLAIDATTKAVSWVDTYEEATKYTTDKDGIVDITGLAEGTYYLEETKAPTDYVKLTDRIEFTVNATSYSTPEGLVDPEKVTNIEKGHLPGTGGNGIVYIIAVGAALVAGATFYFVKRNKNYEA